MPRIDTIARVESVLTGFLKSQSEGQLKVEKIERFLADSVGQVTEGPKSTTTIPLLAERFAAMDQGGAGQGPWCESPDQHLSESGRRDSNPRLSVTMLPATELRHVPMS